MGRGEHPGFRGSVDQHQGAGQPRAGHFRHPARHLASCNADGQPWQRACPDRHGADKLLELDRRHEGIGHTLADDGLVRIFPGHVQHHATAEEPGGRRKLVAARGVQADQGHGARAVALERSVQPHAVEPELVQRMREQDFLRGPGRTRRQDEAQRRVGHMVGIDERWQRLGLQPDPVRRDFDKAVVRRHRRGIDEHQVRLDQVQQPGTGRVVPADGRDSDPSERDREHPVKVRMGQRDHRQPGPGRNPRHQLARGALDVAHEFAVGHFLRSKSDRH